MAPRWSWTQPQCDGCFAGENPGRTPVRLLEPEPEVCVTCGRPATGGIYIRVDPREAAHPTLTKDH